ncbi:chromosome segregation protein SMC [Corynebacterium riegelii]|uniref:chromosome segregation protein SMC n=1 Tax=Corynebacterium riegelii TaxID=156976 RepID=UPI002889EC63|nr:chromosome segregation protein SMC [Corynebacterium riegelii]
MHLKSLTLKGFKSFASATTMKFEPGICAVVGPNGSGKSNVVDALAWVMGEQGAKNLRGGKMQDVIFAGAGERKPLGRAEVTLTFDNSDKRLPIDFTEVAITRRMFRDGASEYEINGAKARLMDVQELLSDSGIGREMHIIVGQGKLAEILESRPEERRAFIEEAAGVLKHRRRKEKAQRKLNGMQANLDRLTDLTEELGKQLKPLARQAEAAKRAATVQSTLRDARLRIAGHQIVTLRTAYNQAVEEAELRKAGAEAAAEALEEAVAIQETIEAEQADAQPAAEAAQRTWFSLSTLAERANATGRIAAERTRSASMPVPYAGQDPEELEARAKAADQREAETLEAAEEAAERLAEVHELVEEAQEEFDAAEREHLARLRAIADRREGVVRLLAQEESLVQAVESAEDEVRRLEETLTETRARARAAQDEAAEVAQRLQVIESERGPLDAAYERARAEAQSAESRLAQLQDARRERERAVFALEARIAALNEHAPKSPAAEVLEGFGPLAVQVSAESGYDVALASALGAAAEALVGEVTPGAIEALGGASRGIIIDAVGGQSWRLETDVQVDWLLDHVVLTPEVQGPVTRLLVDVALADNVEQAREIVDADPRLRAVTPDGVLVGEGWVAAGSAQTTTVEVTAQIDAAQKELETASENLAQLAGTLEGATLAAEDARVAAAAAKAALNEHDTQVASWRRDLSRLQQQASASEETHAKAAGRVNEAELRARKQQQALEETRDRLSRVEEPETEEPSTAERDRAQAKLTQVKAAEMEATMAFRSARQAAEANAGRSAALRKQAEHERQAKARHDEAQKRRQTEAELARAVAAMSEELVVRIDAALIRAASQRDERGAHVSALRARQQEAKNAVAAARQTATRAQESAHAAEIARSQAQVRMDEAEAQATSSLGIAVDDLVAGYTPDDNFDLDAEQQRLRQAEKDLRALGKVNPLALEEFRALEERYGFLSTQLSDVIQARKDLEGVIEDVDAQILTLFTDAWRDVEAEFPLVFATLFPGGEARLILTDPTDMLTTGLEIEARPPGKKVKRLSLLSGGEKSLTALAFLVAIFRARPSPFYVLDEVEAALDDVNLRRLIALLEELREDSQLIVITHQKPTMDVANVLYGVTMRGDGVTRVISQRMQPTPK